MQMRSFQKVNKHWLDVIQHGLAGQVSFGHKAAGRELTKYRRVPVGFGDKMFKLE